MITYFACEYCCIFPCTVFSLGSLPIILLILFPIVTCFYAICWLCFFIAVCALIINTPVIAPWCISTTALILAVTLPCIICVYCLGNSPFYLACICCICLICCLTVIGMILTIVFFCFLIILLILGTFYVICFCIFLCQGLISNLVPPLRNTQPLYTYLCSRIFAYLKFNFSKLLFNTMRILVSYDDQMWNLEKQLNRGKNG